MVIRAVDEYNQYGHLMHADEHIGAFVRGRTREEAIGKFPEEIARYCRWLDIPCDESESSILIVQEKQSTLQICDADSDVLLNSDIPPLSHAEYEKKKALALKSARDFETLYRSIPLKDETVLVPRKTFYGAVPLTAREMYLHTRNVNDYYFSQINVSATNEPDIYTCRQWGFEALEGLTGFLNNPVFDGSYGESWSLRKIFRRFVWHDRIHAKAMYKMAVRLCGADAVENPFLF